MTFKQENIINIKCDSAAKPLLLENFAFFSVGHSETYLIISCFLMCMIFFKIHRHLAYFVDILNVPPPIKQCSEYVI